MFDTLDTFLTAAAFLAFLFRHRLARLLFSRKLVGHAIIFDGDTVEIHGERIRLRFIDSPDNGQPLATGGGDAGAAARRHLAEIIGNGAVTARVLGYDIYDRHLGFLFAGGRNLNRAMIEDGYARIYRDAPLTYRFLELKARLLRRGLWGLGGFESPYLFRRWSSASWRPISRMRAR